jgi:hypothetical protein
MGCIKISKTNKGESILFKTIYNGVANGNEQLATFYYNWFEDKTFDKLFGFNYVDAYKKGIQNERLDENGEPLLIFDKDENKYYFLDKNNNRSYFPSSAKGISKIWTGEQIKNVTSRLVASYIKRHLNVNFNNIDFSTTNSLPKIDKFIVFEINKKIKQLEDITETGTEEEAADAYGRLLYLEEALENIDELKDLVIQKFKDLTIDIKEDEDIEEDLENNREGVIGKASFERSGKSKVTTNVKLRLSLLNNTEKKDEIWDDFTLIDFDVVYSKLQDILSNEIPLENEYLYDIYLNKIQEFSNYFPYLKEVYKSLIDNKDENFRNEFIQGFYKAKNTFVNEKYSKTDKGFSQNTIDLSNSIDKINIVKDMFINAFNNKFTLGDNKIREDLKPYLSKITAEVKQVFNKASVLNNKDKSNVEKIENYKKYTQQLLKNLGLNISDDAFNYYLDFPLNTNLKELSEKDRIEIFNKINNLISKLDNYVLKNINDNLKLEINISKTFQSTDEINKLIRAQAFINNDMSDVNLRIGGEKRWVFSNPSHLHMELERWKKDPSILLKNYYNDPYQESSRWVEEWFELKDSKNKDKSFKELVEIGRANLEKVKLGILGEITLSGTKDEFKKTTDLSFKDYFINNINSVLKTQSFVRTITQADKSTEFTFKSLIKRLKSFVGYNVELDEFELSDEVKKTYFNYYLSELKRALVAKEEVEEAIKNNDYSKLTPHYHYNYKKFLENPKSIEFFNGNAFKSQYFDKLNNGSAKSNIEKEIVDIIYNSNGTLKIKDLTDFTLNKIGLEDKFNNYLQTMITFEARKTLKEMLSLGLIKVENSLYINKLLDINILDEYTQSNTPNGISNAITKMAIDYMINGISNNIEFSKLFTGDVSYYKDSVDFKKRVPATYTDGKYLILKPGEESFNIATIEAVIQDSPFLEALKKDNEINGIDEHTIEMLSDINSTDAQAWITPERWKFLKQRLGEWSEIHDSVFKKMNFDKNEIYTKEELKVAAQPLKGVYFYKINGKPTYLKYSQAVLSKSLIKGTDLERVFDKMTKNDKGETLDYKDQIQELITFDGVKVGSITPTKIHDNNGNLLPNEQLSFNVQTLNNHGWKLQQDLPTKNFKSTDVGSQIQKNILAGIKHYLNNSNFTYKGKKITGQELNDELVKTIGNLSDEGYKRLISKAGIDDKGNIINTKRFYKSLISELKSRGGSENVIKALEAETSLFGIPQTTGKIFQIFASMINKSVIKIQTNGGSFIQMADFGLTYNNIKQGKSGIILNPNIKGLNPPMIRTNEDGSRNVTPGSVFVPASFIAKYIPNWKDFTVDELFISYNGGHPIIDKRIQENIIGYRIPNQGLPSNDSLQIAGILPESAGDTIVAYVGITSKTGSDYDIDKMYVMFPQYEQVVHKEEEVFEQVEKVLRGINNEETLSNYKKFLDKFDNIDNDVLSSDFISEYNNVENKEDKTLFLRNIRKELINFIVNNSESKQVKLTFKDLNFTTTGLQYSTKGAKGEQNKLIEIYKSVLTNPEVYSDLMKSIDNDFIKKEINNLKPEESNSFMNAMNPRDDVKLRYSFLGGKAGVGMEANAMTDIWRTGKLIISNLANFTWGNYNMINKETELDMEYSEELSEEDLNYYVSEMIDSKAPKERIEEFKKTIKKVKIGETLGTILNAFVDIAKDPYISKGNWTTSTTNVGNLMIRMGVHPLYVVNFLANPIISRYNQYQQDNEGLFDNQSGDTFNKFKQFIIQDFIGDEEKGGKPIYSSLYVQYFNDLNISELEDNVDILKKRDNVKTEVIKRLNNSEEDYNKFFNLASSFYNQVYKPESLNLFDRMISQYGEFKLDLQYFRNQIKNEKNTNLNFQITLLNEFRNIQNSSKNLKTIVDFGKLDVNGVGKDPNGIFYLESLLDEIKINSEKTTDENNKPIKGIIKGFDSKLQNTILSKYYNNLLKIKDILEKNSSMFPMSNENVRNLLSVMVDDITKSYSKKEEIYEKLSRQFKTYIYSKVFDIQDTEKENILDNTHKTLQNFKEDVKDKYFIIDNLNISNDKIGLNNSDRSLEFQRLFTNSWEQLFEDHPDFAEQLVKYSFLTSGFNSNRTQFYSYIPYQYFIKLNINNKVKDIFNKSNFEEFENKFYLNNLTDTSIVKNVFDSDLKETLNNKFVLQSTTNKGQFIKVNEEFYRLVGISKTDKFIYVKIKNTPVSNNYNVELDLNNFDENMLKTEQPIVNQEQEIKQSIETKQEVKSEVIKYSDEFFKQIDDNNIKEQLLNPKNKFTLLSKEQYGKDLDNVLGETITKDNIEEAFNNPERVLENGSETEFLTNYYVEEDNNGYDYSQMSIKDIYEDYIKAKSIEEKEALRLFLNTKDFNLLSEEDVLKNYKNPNQLSLFDQLEQDKQLWEEIKDKWIESGRTEADFNSMNNEEREHIIENCL